LEKNLVVFEDRILEENYELSWGQSHAAGVWKEILNRLGDRTVDLFLGFGQGIGYMYNLEIGD
jgi:hypothetical protein